MTTPPTPAGWYPDPDGSGGQRYWDGFAWTEHRAPATPPPPAPAPPPAAAPPPAEAFSSEPTVAVPLGGEEQTAVVPLRPAPTDDHVGAHRKAEPEPEAAEPEPFTQTTEPVAFTPDVPPVAPPPGPPPSSPSPFGYPTTPPAASSANRKLLIGYGAACAALLAALVVAIVYGFFIRDSNGDIEVSAGGTTTSEATDAPTTTGSGGWGDTPGTETATDSPTTVAETGDATDGQLSFTVLGVDVGTTVVSSDAPIEKTAVGEYIVVNMTVTNISPDPATFLGTFQKLLAGGTTYNIDDEATFYVGGGIAELPPGASADVSVAFDVPPGTVAEAIELHADPISPGVEVSLS